MGPRPTKTFALRVSFVYSVPLVVNGFPLDDHRKLELRAYR
jgi:hypothetical protein